jgi:nucleoside-diphosphate kinase
MERTLCLLKPDILKRNLQEQALQDISKHFAIIDKFQFLMSEDQAKEFYIQHEDRPFFPILIGFITKGEIIAVVLEGENAINRYRELIGATNPKDAAEGTLRHRYGISIDENSFHGSDSLENAERELKLFASWR